MVKKSILGIDPNEIVMHEIKRHPIGLFFIYGLAAFLIVLLVFGAILIMSGEGDSGISDNMLTAVAAALALLIVTIAYIAASIYRTNELIITNENLVQILQQSLFDRKVSQLNLAKVQDVTVDQEGILSTMLGYGKISVETAGEASNYQFNYAPRPNIAAKHIIEAHEQYLRTHHIDGQSKVRSTHIRSGGV